MTITQFIKSFRAGFARALPPDPGPWALALAEVQRAEASHVLVLKDKVPLVAIAALALATLTLHPEAQAQVPTNVLIIHPVAGESQARTTSRFVSAIKRQCGAKADMIRSHTAALTSADRKACVASQTTQAPYQLTLDMAKLIAQ